MSSPANNEIAEAAREFSSSDDKKHGETKSRVFQFFSFDIRNSTAYKRADSDWPLLVDQFYELTWDRLFKDDPSFRFWKHIGDEVLAYRPIRSHEEAWRATQHAHRVLHSINDSLRKSFQKARQERLTVKATSWIALCGIVPSGNLQTALRELEDKPYRDIHTIQQYANSPNPIADFLGPTIDSGFRVAKHSGPGILVLSLELTYILCKYLDNVTQSAEHRTFCRLVGYHSLTGILRERPYPIIWYKPPTTLDALTYFSYDDRLDFAEQLQSFGESNAAGEISLCRSLMDIAQDVGIDKTLQAIDMNLRQEASAEDIDETVEVRLSQVEVHCVAICIRDDGKCLVARRLATRALLPNTWEWGCAKLQPNQDVYASMQENYRRVFGVTLDFPYRNTVGTFFIQERMIQGLIFVARSSSDVTLNEGKHSEYRWVSAEEARQLATSANVVENFVERIEIAVEKNAHPGAVA